MTDLFANAGEYLHFVRHQRSFSRSSNDGRCTATISKEDGWHYWYRLSIEGGPTLTRHLHRFRATPQRLAQFHEGCSRMALDMEKFIAKGDRTLLWSSDAFGPLDSDNGDGSDADEWVDRVEDEELLRRLHLVEGHRQDGDEVAAWEELQRIPAQYEFHVEVLRRRLILCHYAGFADHDALTRWARALAAAEPYDAMNWASLEHAVAGADGERHQVAADVLREAIDRHGPDFVLYYSFASRLCSLGRIKEAQDAMRSALDEDPYAITSALDSTCFAPIWGFLSEVQDSRS